MESFGTKIEILTKDRNETRGSQLLTGTTLIKRRGGREGDDGRVGGFVCEDCCFTRKVIWHNYYEIYSKCLQI